MITLRSNYESLRVGLRRGFGQPSLLHDALAAHALMKAILNRIDKYAKSSLYHDATDDPNVKYLRSLLTDAAKILASEFGIEP